MIADNLFNIKEKISAAAKETGRKAEDITLVAVTKTVGIDECNTLLELGQNVFGENRVQVLCEKYETIAERATWHLIGHLQTNKVKYIMDKVSLIHSVDSFKLAEEINRLSVSQGVTKDILLQVNVSGEESKFGMPEEELFPVCEAVCSLENVKIRGLMTIPPLMTVKGSNRKYFQRLYELQQKLIASYGNCISADYLSMGMSDDYDDAIKEGANVVRVGRALYV